jgi:NAD(P)-dependent dehydrogenase (short-subunit alcohol dehydrogenase family)
VKLNGKVALITGGAVRVGRALTLALAKNGVHVVINYHHSSEEAESTAHQAEACGVRALPLQADIADPSAIAHMITAAENHFGGIDILVNNASPWIAGSLLTTTLEHWHQVLGSLLDGPFMTSRLLAPGMVNRGEGAILNILDRSAFDVWPNHLAHSVGKAGLWAMTKALALELAPAVRVNAIVPGAILPPPDMPQERIDRYTQRIPLKRWGSPDDVAAAMLYLLQADFITGEALVVDGGEALQT